MLPTSSSTTNQSVCPAQLPYTWNGQTYNGAGTYSVTLTGSNGCDSVATLVLVINTVLTSTTNVSVCPSQLPYHWNGQVYDTNGSYSVTLSNSNGCDSIATLVLTILPESSSTTSVNICSTALPYVWNSQTYNSSGSYSITLTGSNGCDSVATLILVVLPTTGSQTNVSVCSNQLPYIWNSQSYNAGGNYTVTLTGSNGCDSIPRLTLTVLTVRTSLTTASVCTNQLPYIWNSNSYNNSGTYSVTLTGSNGCDSIARLQLTVNPVVNSSSTVSTCNNQLPYIWNGQSYNSTGTYSVTLTSQAGCDSVATLHLTVNNTSISTTALTVCSSQLPVNWNGQSYNSSGSYTVTLTNSAGCDSLATLNLTVNQTPGAPTVTSPVNYCQYQPAAPLTASGTNTIYWYTSLTGGNGSTTAPTPSTSTTGTTTYYVGQTNNGCPSPRVPVTVVVQPKPALGADKIVRICYGGTADLTNLYNTSTLSNNTWLHNLVPVNDPSSVNQEGLYYLIGSNTAGCSDTAIVNLIMLPPVIANAGPDADAEYNYPYQLQGSGGSEYLWNPGRPLLNNQSIPNPLATLTETTTFVLTVKNELGCSDTDTVTLRVLRGPTFYVPTAFTPNGDGLNDIFRPTYVGIQKLEYFMIFNRFGELVYESHDLNKGWDGTYKGIPQPIDNYVWHIRGIDRKGELKILKGNVVLIR
ncbi:MAG: T9SS type B sorting domain-containing protein [Ferruginibacter sp.]